MYFRLHELKEDIKDIIGKCTTLNVAALKMLTKKKMQEQK